MLHSACLQYLQLKSFSYNTVINYRRYSKCFLYKISYGLSVQHLFVVATCVLSAASCPRFICCHAPVVVSRDGPPHPHVASTRRRCVMASCSLLVSWHLMPFGVKPSHAPSTPHVTMPGFVVSSVDALLHKFMPHRIFYQMLSFHLYLTLALN